MLSRTFVRLLALATVAVNSALAAVYEAEDAILSGTTVGTSVTGFTGTGYVESFDDAADSLTFTIISDTAKLYDLKLKYSAPYGPKNTRLSLNNASGGDVSLAETTDWLVADAGQVLLNAGTNTVTLTTNWGW